MIADAKPTDGPQTFAEGTDHKVHAFFDTGLLCQTPAIGPQNAQGVRFVDHQVGAIFLLHRYDVGQWRAVAQHTVQTLDHHQNIGVALFKTAQALFQIFNVIMTEADDFSSAEAAAVINAGMAVGIQQDNFSRSDNGRQYGQVGNISGGKNDGALATEVVCHFLFQGDVA